MVRLFCFRKRVHLFLTAGLDFAGSLLLYSSVSTRSWVLLRNTHLCPEWLGGLEKKLRGLSLHPSFRLFLTSEVCIACLLRRLHPFFVSTA